MHTEETIARLDGKQVWGILGGMGPLASAEFVNTIYEQTTLTVEQESPIVILLSDPTIPDRTQSLLNGEDQILLQHFLQRINQLVSFGATKIIVCCMTIHPLIPRLPAVLHQKIISLVDVIFDSVLASGSKHLLLCTEGTRQSCLFENHRLWQRAQGQIVRPDPQDQRQIHHLLYEIKKNRRGVEQIESLHSLLKKYELNSYIAACTEMHILAKEQEKLMGLDRSSFCIDPLTIIASSMCHSPCMSARNLAIS
jgi:aspartate racemase